MSAITLTQAQAQLDAWMAAGLAVAQAQSYQIGERQLTRANASEIRKNIDYWSAKVSVLTAQQAGGAGRSGRSRTVLLGR